MADHKQTYTPSKWNERTSVASNKHIGETNREHNLGPPEIPHDEFIIEQFLGEGAFGKVYKGQCRGKTVAIKEPIKQDLSEEEYQTFVREIRTMSTIFHPNIVLYLGGCTKPDRNNFETFKICMEYCETDVEILLRQDRRAQKSVRRGLAVDPKYHPLTMKDRLLWAKDAALGMNWLHGINNVVHGDLKTANLLIDANNRIKVGDFGFSKIKKGSDLTQDPYPVGTPVYMAPEVMMGLPYDGFKADVYAFGYILWEIATSGKLFSQYKQWKPFKKAITEDNIRPPITDDIPTPLVYLMSRCWDKDPLQRPSFAEIVFRLDECLVDACIQDELGREFWKDHFLFPKQILEERVQWADFREILADSVNVDQNIVKKLKDILAFNITEVHQEKKIVTMEHFNAMLHTFGHFCVPNKANEILRFIYYLVQQPWFHGNIDRYAALQRLNNKPENTWLLRLRDPFDAKAPGCPFVIAKVYKGSIQQRLIGFDPFSEQTEYILQTNDRNKVFSSLELLINDPSLKLLYPADTETEGYTYSSNSDDD